MKTLALLAGLGLAACGSVTNQAANSSQDATSAGAVTAEAISDTQAAEADAMKAADAELDNLGNTIDDDAENKAVERVSNSTKVEVY